MSDVKSGVCLVNLEKIAGVLPSDELKALMYETAANLIVIGMIDGAKLAVVANRIPFWSDKKQIAKLVQEKFDEDKEFLQYIREKAKAYKR